MLLGLVPDQGWFIVGSPLEAGLESCKLVDINWVIDTTRFGIPVCQQNVHLMCLLDFLSRGRSSLSRSRNCELPWGLPIPGYSPVL